MSKLQISYVPINELKESEFSARIHSDGALEQLKKSIKEHDIVDPILINIAKGREMVIIGGAMRVKACKALKHKTIPVIQLNIPDIEKEKALCIRLNAIGGEWDIDALKEFSEDFLLDAGFEPDELALLYGDVLDTEEDDFSVEKALAEINTPISKTGELYQLGPHRLLVGDASNLEDVKRVVGDEKMDIVYNDPFYNIGLRYDVGIGGTKNYGGSTKDSMSESAYEAFLKKTMENALAVSKKDVHIFYYSDQKYVTLIMKLYDELGINFKRTCIWLKGISNPTPQVAFSKVYEPITYGVRGKPWINPQFRAFHEVLNKEITNGHRVIDEFYDMIDVWAVNRLSGQEYEHPTQKPITLHDKPIKRCTQVGGNLLSLFGGSGGELIAADQLKRKAFLVEKDPIFADLIKLRYERYSGNTAVKIG
ncbi:MAG: DNA methyltransferase [Candidatus Paceibacterota bacterium]